MGSFTVDELRALELEDRRHTFNNTFNREEYEAAFTSHLNNDLDIELNGKKRREFPAGRFLKEELMYIAKTYCDNYETFFYATVYGGKDKDAIVKKKALLSEMARYTSALGEERRTPEQVEQKIRDELKRVRKYLAFKKQGNLNKGRRDIILSSPQQMIADLLENTKLEPLKPPGNETNGLDDAGPADTSAIDVPTTGSSAEVSPPMLNQLTPSPLPPLRIKRRISEIERSPPRSLDDLRNDFDFAKEKRRVVEDDMKYARARLEAVTAERDYWMAKIDLLDLERQFWMREIERSLSGRY